MKIRAPAKVNLFLRVLGRRDDGYHSIDSLMVPVSLYDEIEIVRARKKKGRSLLAVSADHPEVPSGRKNLAYRAAALLLARKNLAVPIAIRIRKAIPVGAGLGGGSSDAAATLVGLNRLLRLGCSRKELASIAAEIGADVPFFIYGTPARARGIGERLTRITSLPKLWMVLIYPCFPVSTAGVFRDFPLKLTKDIEDSRINFSLKRPAVFAHRLVNDLEEVTLRRYPGIGALKERLLREGAAGAVMSGSGSSVFGIFSGESQARKAFQRLRRWKGVNVYLVHSLN
jgi:4-diphosphocytidyl-2-C-methyl-D-erythritol kinase